MEIKVTVPEGLKVDVYPPAAPTDIVTLDGKPQQASVITLDGGTHFIRIREVKPPKPAPVDKSLEPKPIALVEVLENTYHFGRRREISERRHTRRKPGKTPLVDVPIHEEPLADEMTPEQIGEALGVDISELEEVASVETSVEQPKTESRRGRGRRSRERSAEPEVIMREPESAPEAAPAEAVSHEAEPIVSDESGQAVSDRPRRRSRRGGRGRRGQGRTAGEAPSRKPYSRWKHTSSRSKSQQPAPETEHAAEHRRRNRRGGRGRRGRGRAATGKRQSKEPFSRWKHRRASRNLTTRPGGRARGRTQAKKPARRPGPARPGQTANEEHTNHEDSSPREEAPKEPSIVHIASPAPQELGEIGFAPPETRIGAEEENAPGRTRTTPRPCSPRGCA